MVLRVIIRDIDESLIYIESDDFFLFERKKKKTASPNMLPCFVEVHSRPFLFLFLFFSFFLFLFLFGASSRNRSVAGRGEIYKTNTGGSLKRR